MMRAFVKTTRALPFGPLLSARSAVRSYSTRLSGCRSRTWTGLPGVPCPVICRSSPLGEAEPEGAPDGVGDDLGACGLQPYRTHAAATIGARRRAPRCLILRVLQGR